MALIQEVLSWAKSINIVLDLNSAKIADKKL